MTDQPAGQSTEQSTDTIRLAVGALMLEMPDGTTGVQLRLVVGPSCYLLELPADQATWFGDQVQAETAKAAAAAKRANAGAPALIVPPGIDPAALQNAARDAIQRHMNGGRRG